MARTKQFDPDVALDAAMRVFWRHGYEATSTAMLVAELGIGRASLYDTFGSKRALYEAALEHFLASVSEPMLSELIVVDGPVLDAVRAFLLRSADEPQNDDPRGCFAVNAAVENGDVDAGVVVRLERSRRQLEAALHGALLRARAEGELADSVDPKAAASMLVALNTGLKVLSRAGAGERARIETSIDSVMSVLARTPR